MFAKALEKASNKPIPRTVDFPLVDEDDDDDDNVVNESVEPSNAKIVRTKTERDPLFMFLYFIRKSFYYDLPKDGVEVVFESVMNDVRKSITKATRRNRLIFLFNRILLQTKFFEPKEKAATIV